MTDNQDKNIFGGANPSGMYVPMTETEQEVLDRLVQSQDLEIEIVGWGVVHNPWVKFGDHRIGLEWTLTFNKPPVPKPVYYFDLELRVASSKTFLMKKRYPTTVGGKPTLIGAGLGVTFMWDIAIDHMSPALVKAIVPGAIGLTTRRLDPVTGNRTLEGNMHLAENQSKVANFLDMQSEALKRKDDKEAIQVTKAAGQVSPDPE
jgi:hypothetical protein